MKRFIVLVMILCCSILIIGCGGTPAQTTYMDVKAEDMLKDYIRDTGIAENKYKGRNVQLTGQLLSKGQFKNSSNFYAVLLQRYTLGRKYSIAVEYPVDKSAEINKLNYGDFVVAKGECVGIVPQEDPTEISVQVRFGAVASGTNNTNSANTTNTQTTPLPIAPSNGNSLREGIITGTEVRIRASGDKTGAILGHFYKGEKVKIIEVAEKWTKVERSNGQIGWVSNDFCSLQ